MNIRQNKPKLNPQKARQAILYILNKCGTISEQKLIYLLFFIDFDFYEKYEEHFLGFTYFKQNKSIKIL